MTDKELIKSYKDTFKAVSNKSTEKEKRVYINAFNAFDKKLNKDLESYIKKLNVRPISIDFEISRIKKVLNALHYRLDVRERMINDYKTILGYKPKKLPEIPHEKDYKTLKSTLSNLSKASETIKELITSGKEIRRIKNNNTIFKNQNTIESKIKKLIDKRVKLIDLLRNSPDIMEDLYDFAIKAPFNEENGYINYLIVKSDPKNKFKTSNEKNKKNDGK